MLKTHRGVLSIYIKLAPRNRSRVYNAALHDPSDAAACILTMPINGQTSAHHEPTSNPWQGAQNPGAEFCAPMHLLDDFASRTSAHVALRVVRGSPDPAPHPVRTTTCIAIPHA